jgi:hypothetical protein
MTCSRLSTRTAIIRFWLVLLAVALFGIGLRAPHVQAQDLAPTVAPPEYTVTVNAAASCVDGYVVLTWSAQAAARVTVSYMGLNSGPYDLAAPTFKVEGSLHTDLTSAPATVVTFASEYWSGSHWVTLAPQTKNVAPLSCNAPTAVSLRTFTATSGTGFAFVNRLGQILGIAR